MQSTTTALALLATANSMENNLPHLRRARRYPHQIHFRYCHTKLQVFNAYTFDLNSDQDTISEKSTANDKDNNGNETLERHTFAAIQYKLDKLYL